MSGAVRSLAGRFREEVLSDRGSVPEGPLVVGVSGGLDSTVLLHLLRFTPGLPDFTLHVAHLDHGLRRDSAADVAWVRGLSRAWGLPLSQTRAEGLDGSEASARNARLAYLERVRRAVGASWVALGHHADDQAETVLHRAVRGTGLGGLSGMARFREPGFWRPLLGFWRQELEAYAFAVGLGWREDSTNAGRAYARNVLRHDVLPTLEAGVAPGSRRALLRLAELAREESAAWDAALAALEPALGLRRSEAGISLDAAALRALPDPLRARVIRRCASELGSTLELAATRAASDFAARSLSGRAHQLTGGLLLRRELDRVTFTAEEPQPGDVPLLIAGELPGRGIARVGGKAFRVGWGAAGGEESANRIILGAGVRFPLTVRGRRPGDRIALPYGSKKLKKLLLEARVPEPERRRLPVLVDADDRVLWVPGVARSALCDDRNGPALQIEIDDVEHH